MTLPPEIVSRMFGPCALCAPRRPIRLTAYSARVVRVEMLSLTSPKFREAVQRRAAPALSAPLRRRVSEMVAANLARCRGGDQDGTQ
jgi:hypothetical protein